MMEEKKIKELISERYPNAGPFWTNNKDWIKNLIKEVQKESKESYRKYVLHDQRKTILIKRLETKLKRYRRLGKVYTELNRALYKENIDVFERVIKKVEGKIGPKE